MGGAGKGIFIIGAKRTPFCNYGGPLREFPASHAFAAAAKDAMLSANLEPTVVDSTVVGNLFFLSQCDGGKTPRYCGIYSGVSIEKPALGVNRACGTGIQAIITGATEILTGQSRVLLTGGTEIMSSLPRLIRNTRFGTVLGSSYKMEDHIQLQFLDSFTGLTLTKVAEDMAIRYHVTRKEIDEYVLQSRLRWKTAQDSNVFEMELTSLTVNLKKQLVVDKDHMQESAEELSRLPAIVDGGVLVTNGNISMPADGAAALLLASEIAVEKNSLLSLARIAAWSSVGVDPSSGLGAAAAVRRLIEEQKLSVDDVDLFEINETSAAQVLVSAKELKLDLQKVNVNGGALALGNPVSASGARMVIHLAHELGRRNLKRGIAASSCGGGQGLAILLDRS